MQELLLGALAGFVLSLLGNLWLSRNRTQTIDKLAVKVEDMLETITKQETRIDTNCTKIDSLNKDVTSLNATYQFLRETMTEIKTAISDGFKSVNERMDRFAEKPNSNN